MAGTTLEQITDKIQSIIRASIPDIKKAPDKPPETSAVFPYAISLPGDGSWRVQSQGWREAQHRVITEIHVARGILPKDVDRALPLHEKFVEAIFSDPSLGGLVEGVLSIDYTFGWLDWGDEKEVHLGWRFTSTVVIQPVG